MTTESASPTPPGEDARAGSTHRALKQDEATTIDLLEGVLLYRSSLKDVKYGALQVEWTYPVYPDQPNGLRWFVQAFRGYGETLTDYNFRQTSIGVGVTFLQF